MNLKTFNVVQPQEQPKEEVNSAVKMANVSIRVDANCFLLCDGEFTEIELQAGKITKVQLPIGQHLLEFVDIEYPEVKMEKEVDWPWYGQLMREPQTMVYFLQINRWLQLYNVSLV
jgi:hypothetical protein